MNRFTLNRSAKIPEPFASVMADVQNHDRRWFEQHPGVSEYDREYVPGEFFPELLIGLEVVGVHVDQIRPGFRHRAPILRVRAA